MGNDQTHWWFHYCTYWCHIHDLQISTSCFSCMYCHAPVAFPHQEPSEKHVLLKHELSAWFQTNLFKKKKKKSLFLRPFSTTTTATGRRRARLRWSTTTGTAGTTCLLLLIREPLSLSLSLPPPPPSSPSPSPLLRYL